MSIDRRTIARWVAAFSIAALAPGCGTKGEDKPTEPTTAQPTAPPPDAAAKPTEDNLGGRLQPVLSSSSQLVVAVTDDWDDATATMYQFERTAGQWQQVGSEYAATLGRTGLAWGIGEYGAHGKARGGPALPGPVKHEGDGKSPAGIFNISDAFGYGDKPPAGTKTRYTQLDKSWVCVDDAKSAHYNRVFKPAEGERDFDSHEQMRRDDILYKWVILIDHNARIGGEKAQPGAGSCIFFHVWRAPGSPTVGCVAMAQDRIETLLSWLDPGVNPMVALLPREQYRILRLRYGMPELPDKAPKRK